MGTGIGSLNITCDNLSWLIDEDKSRSKSISCIEKIDDENNEMIITADIPGVHPWDVTVESKWVNRTKSMYLVITIKDENRYKVPATKEISVDTDVYDKWSYRVADGVLTITLHEIIHEKPKFEKL